MLQAAVAAILWRRKLHKQFPVFFMFLLAQVANFAVTFPLWATDRRTVYFGFFWLGEAINAVLGFKVIHEIFVDVFRPYHTLKDLGSLVFKWAGVVMLLVAVVVAFSNSADRNPLVLIMTTLQPAVRVAQVGLVLFLLLFSRFLGVSRKQVSFGISLGFGLLAGGSLLRWQYVKTNMPLDHLRHQRVHCAPAGGYGVQDVGALVLLLETLFDRRYLAFEPPRSVEQPLLLIDGMRHIEYFSQKTFTSIPRLV